MQKTDKFIIGFLLGAAFPMLFMLLSIILWFYTVRNEAIVLVYLGTGLLLGLIIDFLFLKNWITNRYTLKTSFLIGLYIFYNICLFGMFMGFPVFNLTLGLVAAYYTAHQIKTLTTTDDLRMQKIKSVSQFSAIVMFFICILSASIGLLGIGVGDSIQQMLRLSFEVTKPMILMIAILGSILLVFLQSTITKTAIKQFIAQ